MNMLGVQSSVVHMKFLLKILVFNIWVLRLKSTLDSFSEMIFSSTFLIKTFCTHITVGKIIIIITII